MRAVVQRVKESSVKADRKIVGRIGKGLLVLLGVAEGDAPSDADYLANKIVNLRIFEDDDAKMNRSLLSIGGGIGQARTYMYLLRTAHLGEVTVTVWPQQLKDICAERNIHVLE